MNTPQNEAWTRALEKLQRFVPKAASFSAEEIAHAAQVAQKPVNWRQIRDFDDLDDIEIWQRIRPVGNETEDNQVTLIADACFMNDIGPITTSSAGLAPLIEDFVDHYDDQLFGGDVIIMFPLTLLVVHHDGLVAELK
ncbi:MAG: hypothetical protein Tsb0020_37140 [Haliangiales bacterium]